jgi:large subunit ribosomal protein L32
LKEPELVKCQKCGNFILPHTVCPFCGYYKGRQVIDVLAKLEEKERKKREKEMRMKEEMEKKKEKLSLEELSKK